jgi:hypothetical protein
MHVEPIILPQGSTVDQQESAYNSYESLQASGPLKRYPFGEAMVDGKDVLVGWVRVG